LLINGRRIHLEGIKAPTHADLAYLICKLDNYLAELYPADEILLVDFNDPSIDEVFLLCTSLCIEKIKFMS